MTQEKCKQFFFFSYHCVNFEIVVWWKYFELWWQSSSVDKELFCKIFIVQIILNYLAHPYGPNPGPPNCRFWRLWSFFLTVSDDSTTISSLNGTPCEVAIWVIFYIKQLHIFSLFNLHETLLLSSSVVAGRAKQTAAHKEKIKTMTNFCIFFFFFNLLLQRRLTIN